MSRVDDDHQARKLIEQLALKKANEQERAQKQGASAFANRLQTAKPKEVQQHVETRSLAQEAFDRLRAQSGAGTSAPARQARAAPGGLLGQQLQQTEQHQKSTTQTQQQGAVLTRSEQAEVRRESHRDTSSRLDERGQSSLQRTHYGR